jgi:hypothetical protein
VHDSKEVVGALIHFFPQEDQLVTVAFKRIIL